MLVILGIVFYVLLVVAHWKIFTKAGQRGWTSLIPILNIFVLVKVVKRPMWWAAVISLGLIFSGASSDAAAIIQVVSAVLGLAMVVLLIVVLFDLSKAFGHGGGFALGLIILSVIFALILGYGPSTYQLEPEPLF